MRLAVLIKDAEYRDALIKKISSYDNNIFVNIFDGSVKDTSDCLILTDVNPSRIDRNALSAIKDRTVFITTSEEGFPEDLNRVFKFSSVSSMVSDLSIAYNSWHGIPKGIVRTSRFITVCCESDAYSSECCRALARQIIYRHGGSLLILPLSYINDYGLNGNYHTNILSRLLYSIRSGRDRGTSAFAQTDSYGISNIILKPGINPVAYLDEDELRLLVSGLSKGFDTIIGDIATCFRKENSLLMDMSDHTVLFESGRRNAGFNELIGNNRNVLRVRITGETEDAAAIDDCVKEIFGMENNESFKS